MYSITATALTLGAKSVSLLFFADKCFIVLKPHSSTLVLFMITFALEGRVG